MRTTTRLLDESGLSLVMALIAGMILSILGYVTVSTVITDARTGAAYLEATQAFWLAESGMELAYRWLRYENPPPEGILPFVKYDGVQGGAGTFTVTIYPNEDNPTHYRKTYRLLAVGNVDGLQRKIEVETQMTTFNEYSYLTGSEGGTIWFNTGDLIEGKMHSNDQISITGSPVFMGKLTSSANTINQGASYNPDFQDGYQLGVPPVHFPTAAEILAAYTEETGGPPALTIDASGSRNASITFNADGTFTYSVWRRVRVGGRWRTVYDVEDAVVNIADLDGLVYVDGDVDIKGTVDGNVTVLATDNINITDDVIYEMSDASGKPTEDCDDMLGLISLKQVVVEDNAANRTDVVIDAAILALDRSFTVENYASGPFRGDLTIWGSLSQHTRGPVGTFGGGRTGYEKDYHYDQRFEELAPPFFPTTGQYHFNYWREVTD